MDNFIDQIYQIEKGLLKQYKYYIGVLFVCSLLMTGIMVHSLLEINTANNIKTEQLIPPNTMREFNVSKLGLPQ